MKDIREQWNAVLLYLICRREMGTQNIMEKKLLYEVDELDQILKKGCLLFGAGRVSKTIVKYASQKKWRINGIVVSDIKSNPENIMGIKVHTLNEANFEHHNKCLIVCVMEKSHGSVWADILPYEFSKIYFLSNELFYKLDFEMASYDIEQLSRMDNLEDKIENVKKEFLRFVPRPCFEYMVLNILDHCNLKCKGCDHFACIADPYFVKYETIHKDLDRLAEIFHGDYIIKIAVMGGEPLLHPDLLRILKDVRKHFPYTIIRLTTNGLLLMEQGDEFWSVCREQDVTIVNTKYPINLDFNKIKQKVETEGVKFQFFEGTGDRQIKKSFKKIINLRGDSNPVESFANCHISNYGNFLMEGKIYSCPFSCQSYRIFNKKFHQNLRMTEKDFLDIYKVQDMKEILEFAARPKYYCRYCRGLSPLFDWTRSKQKIEEWVEGENSLC